MGAFLYFLFRYALRSIYIGENYVHLIFSYFSLCPNKLGRLALGALLCISRPISFSVLNIQWTWLMLSCWSLSCLPLHHFYWTNWTTTTTSLEKNLLTLNQNNSTANRVHDPRELYPMKYSFIVKFFFALSDRFRRLFIVLFYYAK